jgi:two-component system, NarL family, sensor histidine kinase DesK
MAIRADEPAAPPAGADEHGADQHGARQTATDWLAPGVMAGGLRARYVPGTGGPQRWLFSSIWLVYLVAPVSGLFGHRHGAAWIAGGLAIGVSFCVVYAPTVAQANNWPRLARLGLGALAGLAALACAVYGAGWTVLWIYVSAAAGMVLSDAPNRRQLSRLAILGVGASYTFFCWLSHTGVTQYLVVLLPVLLVGVAMIGFRQQITLMRELAQARETVAKLAANEERLRLARDLHDLTGQSLSMITLKSDLAAKRLSRLPACPERDAALGDLGDIGLVSRQTLHDIREAVSGYRRPTLAIEVITARNVLDAAGVRFDDDAQLTLRSGTFDADAEAALAWCLREAVTNVIRHSGARSCRARLIRGAGELTLEVTDDGRGPQPQDAPRGAGLRGMSERLSAVGGRLSLGPAEAGSRAHGFRLTATVPVERYDT